MGFSRAAFGGLPLMNYLPRHSLSCLFSTASIAENRGEMPFMSHATAMPGHLSVAVDARSPGRSVSEAFFQAVGVHNPHDRPARQHLDMDLVKNRGKRAIGQPAALFARY